MNVSESLHARWSLDSGEHEHVVFRVEGIHCTGCARNIERAVHALPDIERVRVDSAAARVSVDWLGAGASGLPQILAAVERAGFRVVPLAGDAATDAYQKERHAALKRFGLASLGMMQAMMYLAALYGASDIDAAMTQLMRVAGMVIVTPVLFYSGAPFLGGAWRDLVRRRLGMDVPVALALLLAWLPSVVNTLRGTGEVYFDSVGMFIFFLSAGRFIEMGLRHRGLTSAEALARSLPAQVTRVRPDGGREKATAAAIAIGDRFIVPTGGIVAVDAQLATDLPPESIGLLDESLITGESLAVTRRAGEAVRGGSLNVGGALTLVATATVGDSTLASIVGLLDRAQRERPSIARAADAAASWFVLVVLALAALTATAWGLYDSTRAFGAVLAVLVVTCPCALSLATPAVLAAVTARLARMGVLVTHGDAIERLARIDTVVLDKTGTLTLPSTAITDIKLPPNHESQPVLAIAAALERGSLHPIARAFVPHEEPTICAQSVRELSGEGVEGVIAGETWRLGTFGFAGGLASFPPSTATFGNGVDSTLYLGNSAGLAAAFEVGAPLRPDARDVIRELRGLGLQIVIASGDNEAGVRTTARSLDVSRAHSRMSPQSKIDFVAGLRSQGHKVFMIGDGINDGPVLAAADVSCAMGEGSAVAQSAADLLLLHDGLGSLPGAVTAARQGMRVVRQNLAWALGYNLMSVPLAAFGLVPPWLAALGMSLSSLLVVLNARRIGAESRAP
ncbi:MAG: cation-translocating P-type ATPase [Pseudomonadota bacterium]